jgi:hypothetical protein
MSVVATIFPFRATAGDIVLELQGYPLVDFYFERNSKTYVCGGPKQVNPRGPATAQDATTPSGQ